MSTIAISYGVGGARLPSRAVKLVPLTLATVSGTGREATALSADASDTWSIGGKPATVVAREYRLLINGSAVSGAQASPTVVLPAGTAGRSYSCQLRVKVAEAGGTFSSWVTLKSGTVLYAAPQGIAALSDVSLSVGDAARVIDLASHFSGTNLVYAVQSGALPASSTLIGSVLTIAATETFGPTAILIRASNPGGTADQELQIGITAGMTAPGVFQPGDWNVAAVPSTGAIDIEISALPPNGGSPLTGIEYRLDGGSFTGIGGSSTGTYRVAGLGMGQTRLLELRAVNGVGAGAASVAKSVTTASVPAAFTSGQWSVSDPGTGDDIRITISALPETGGAALTRLQYNVGGTGWVDFPGAPATGSFDLSGVVAAGATSSIVIRAGNALGDGAPSDAKSVTPTVSTGFDLTSTVDGEVEVNGGTGDITITITSPAIYAGYDTGSGAGVFTFNSSDLAGGPANLVPPQIGGPVQPKVGDVLTYDAPGLWVYDGDTVAPTIALQWMRNGAPISGATAASLTLQAADEGADMALSETATGANGSRNAVSDILTVTPDAFSLTSTVDGEMEIDGATGDLTVTVTSPAEYAGYDAGNGPGIFTAKSADLATGPVNLVPPQVPGESPVAVGVALSAVPGLWIYDGATAAPQVTLRWLQGSTAIGGATSGSYTTQTGDAGATILVEETAAGVNGTRMALSAGVAVQGAGSGFATLLVDEFDAGDGYVLSNDIPATSANWSALFADVYIAARVSPLGIAAITRTAANQNIRVAYASAVRADQAIEVVINEIVNSSRADPVIFVRQSGASTNGTGVRAFWKTSTSELQLTEFGANSVVRQNVIGNVLLSPGDVIRLEVIGTTAVAMRNGTPLSTLTGLTVAGGAPGWGAYLGNNANDRVAYRSARIEEQ